MPTRPDVFDDFLPDHEPPPRSWALPEGADNGFDPVDLFLGRGDNPIEVACATWTGGDAPPPTKLRTLWTKRHGGAASPLLLLVAYSTGGEGVRIAACGPVGDQPPVEIGLDLSQAERIAGAALTEPNRHFAIRFLSAVLPEIGGDLVGLRNQGMFATHALQREVRGRADWTDAQSRGKRLLASRGRDLLTGLGFGIEQLGSRANVLTVEQHKRAVAVLLEEHAFEQTCRRMAASNQKFLDLLDKGIVATGKALRDLGSVDNDDLDELIAEDDLDRYGDWVSDSGEYRLDELRQHVGEDIVLLTEFADIAAACMPDDDPKLHALADELAQIAADAEREGVSEQDTRNKRKTLVFTYFADTAQWAYDWLVQEAARRDDLAAFRGRIGRVTGTDRDDKVVWGFAPDTTDAPSGIGDDYDVLIATDVLAEGVNLQQARNLVSFDLPWNPQRLVQRHGRIDRLNSSHNRVFIRCVFPAAQLDVLLQLEERLRRKITQAAMSVGVAREVLPDSDTSDHSFATTSEEIRKLADGDATLLETGGGVSALSGEEFRQQLRAYLKTPGARETLEELPWGAGSGFVRSGAAHGFVFCAQVGDHPTPLYRYVEVAGLPDGDTTPTALEADALLSFAHAGPPSDETLRALSDEQIAAAYPAWEAARADILGSWTHATDPRNLQPKVPKVLREAAQLIREHPPAGVPQDELDRWIDALEAPLGNRHQNLIRAAMRLGGSDESRAESVMEAARQLGLQRHKTPEPLPEINEDDIHLICWQAIAP